MQKGKKSARQTDNERSRDCIGPGGDLLLYDTDVTTDIYGSDFTRLAPLDYSLVLFPSHCHHQISPVVCETTDFANGRFTLNGWLHTERTERNGSTEASA